MFVFLFVLGTWTVGKRWGPTGVRGQCPGGNVCMGLNYIGVLA